MTSQTDSINMIGDASPQAHKWINTFLFLFSALAGYIFSLFLEKLGIWFELESKIPQYKYAQLLVSLLVVVGTMMYVRSRHDLMLFFYETFEEMTKVVFPDKNQSLRLSIFVIIWVTIIGFALTLIDWMARFLIQLIAKA